jgi:hypothetical protein
MRAHPAGVTSLRSPPLAGSACPKFVTREISVRRRETNGQE